MASLTVLFWNTQKKDLARPIARLLRTRSIDLVVLAELPDTAAHAQRRLAEEFNGPIFYSNVANLFSKTHLFSVHPSSFTHHRYGNASGRLNVFEVELPLFPRFLLGTVHLVSKVNASEPTQAEEARETMGELRDQCAELGTVSFLLCGDFNCNPFERAMSHAGFFHAAMDRHTALREKRTIQGRDYPILYNPMWSLLGDYPEGPPGTHYHSPAAHETTHWHMLDQFLLSPALLRSATVDEVSILTGDGTDSFLTPEGRIRADVYSDHLPILLRLTENP